MSQWTHVIGSIQCSWSKKEAIEKYMDTYYEQTQAGIFVKKIEVEYNKQKFIAFVGLGFKYLVNPNL